MLRCVVLKALELQVPYAPTPPLPPALFLFVPPHPFFVGAVYFIF